jgi:S-adenosylmethionine-diacylglycerol 3-amino-3-carboxypropyl transferase
MNAVLTMSSEIVSRADFGYIRYAQCWEDADILLNALNIQAGDTCIAIASAGDNALAMLSKNPARVIALDLSPAQLACLELRVAAYKTLEHKELLELIGSRHSQRRMDLYKRCRLLLPNDVKAFWDSQPKLIEAGIGSGGKFERYFATFRKYVLRLIHSRKTIERLLTLQTAKEREDFYTNTFNTWRWQGLFRLFFSRFVMGRMGRDPEFFKYVEGSVSERILARTRHALTVLSPAENPYLQWIMTGHHPYALPYALRAENFEAIRNNLDRIEIHALSLESYLERLDGHKVQRYNLSDIFEYMSLDNYHALLGRLVDAASPGARLAYWNMLAPRQRPETMAGQLRPLGECAKTLHQQDKAFFYSAFVLEEVI